MNTRQGATTNLERPMHHTISAANGKEEKRPTGLLRAYRNLWNAKITANERTVYLCILDHWSKKNPKPFPATDRLVFLTDLSMSTVLRALASLEAKGALGIVRAHKHANKYDVSAAFEGRLPMKERPAGPAPGCQPDSLLGVTQTSLGCQGDTLRDQGLSNQKEGSKAAPSLSPSASSEKKNEKASKGEPIPANFLPTTQHASWAKKWKVDINPIFKAFFAEAVEKKELNENWNKALNACIARAGEAREKEPKTWYDGDNRTHAEIVSMQEASERAVIASLHPETKAKYDMMVASGQLPKVALKTLWDQHQEQKKLKELAAKAVA